jgi:hypothetical protein
VLTAWPPCLIREIPYLKKYKILVGISEGGDHLEDRCINDGIILK